MDSSWVETCAETKFEILVQQNTKAITEIWSFNLQRLEQNWCSETGSACNGKQRETAACNDGQQQINIKKKKTQNTTAVK